MSLLLGSVVRDAMRGFYGRGGRRAKKLHKKKKTLWTVSKSGTPHPLLYSNTSCQSPHHVSLEFIDGSCRVEGNLDGGGVQEPASLGVLVEIKITKNGTLSDSPLHDSPCPVYFNL